MTYTDQDKRNALVNFMSDYDGVGAGAATKDKYNDIIAPSDVEPTWLQQEMDSMWSCALTVLGWMRKYLGKLCPAGIDPLVWAKFLAIDWKAYVISMAMTDVQNIARLFNAWRQPTEALLASELPQAGDHVLIDNAYHVLSIDEPVVWCDPVNGVDFTKPFRTIEGGNVDKLGNKCIKAGCRRLRIEGGKLLLDSVDPTTGQVTAHHTVYGWVDVSAMPMSQDFISANVLVVGGDSTAPAQGDETGTAPVAEAPEAAPTNEVGVPLRMPSGTKLVATSHDDHTDALPKFERMIQPQPGFGILGNGLTHKDLKQYMVSGFWWGAFIATAGYIIIDLIRLAAHAK